MKDLGLLDVDSGGLRGTDGSLLWNATVPYWVPTEATLLPAPFAFRRIRRRRLARRRGAANLCPDRGYDLRATPGRCPECGKAAA